MFKAVVEGDFDAFMQAIRDGADLRANRFGIGIGSVACGYARAYDFYQTKVNIKILMHLYYEKILTRKCIDEIGRLRFQYITSEIFDAMHEIGLDRSNDVMKKLVVYGDVELWNHCKGRITIDLERRSAFRTGNRLTPLHGTILNVSDSGTRDPRRIDALLDAGCGIEDRYRGDTPLILAVKVNDQGAVETLLRRGARTDVKDGDDYTLDQVLESCGFPKIKSSIDAHWLSQKTASTSTVASRARL